MVTPSFDNPFLFFIFYQSGLGQIVNCLMRVSRERSHSKWDYCTRYEVDAYQQRNCVVKYSDCAELQIHVLCMNCTYIRSIDNRGT